jgi:hypothetical protein
MKILPANFILRLVIEERELIMGYYFQYLVSKFACPITKGGK